MMDGQLSLRYRTIQKTKWLSTAQTSAKMSVLIHCNSCKIHVHHENHWHHDAAVH